MASCLGTEQLTVRCMRRSKLTSLRKIRCREGCSGLFLDVAEESIALSEQPVAQNPQVTGMDLPDLPFMLKGLQQATEKQLRHIPAPAARWPLPPNTL